MKVPFIASELQIGFNQGELVATARVVLQSHTRGDTGNGYNLEAEYELKRLIGNLFQLRNNPIGDPVQLALLILFMHGEQYGGAI